MIRLCFEQVYEFIKSFCIFSALMTALLPPNLLRLFAPRPPIKYLPPCDKDFNQRRRPVYNGLAQYLEQCADHDQDFVATETVRDIIARKKREKLERAEKKLRTQMASWDPLSDPNLKSDPYKTLFVAGLVLYF